MDEHTDWVNQLMYLEQANSLLSCSNDTTIKLWKLPDEAGNLSDTSNKLVAPATLGSFYTIDHHNDYVRAMSYSSEASRLFSVSDDGALIIQDLNQGAVVREYAAHINKLPKFCTQYSPLYLPQGG